MESVHEQNLSESCALAFILSAGLSKMNLQQNMRARHLSVQRLLIAPKECLFAKHVDGSLALHDVYSRTDEANRASADELVKHVSICPSFGLRTGLCVVLHGGLSEQVTRAEDAVILSSHAVHVC